MTRLRCRPHNVSRLAAGSVLILSILLTSILPLPVAGQTSRSEDDDCDGQVVSLPVTNVTISTGQAKRGIELQLGSPLNSFAFAPDADE